MSTYSDSGQQPLGYISHNDANEEDDGLQPAVAQDDGQDEEGDTQEDGHASDDMDEVLNLLGDGGLPSLKARGEGGDAAHDCAVSGADDDAACCAWVCGNTQKLRVKCAGAQRDKMPNKEAACHDGRTFHAVSGEESDVPGLQGVVMGTVR